VALLPTLGMAIKQTPLTDTGRFANSEDGLR